MSTCATTAKVGFSSTLILRFLTLYSFYPLFPVPQELAHEVNLDVTHSQLLRLGESDDGNVAPDVLIIPSRLKHFSKVKFLAFPCPILLTHY